ncbi:hypothetical protein PENANT_c009G04808 [Penicillium antarcticum]|uniref:Adenosine deaminase domain-containing protein n=1 Tax=Penicillium antarcticum TaxID=416450 RepID=A0A1V6Q9T5_9EURO|nr:hypothetical protein PENANT_c009G04808 [Penicillium antarcticum]
MPLSNAVSFVHRATLHSYLFPAPLFFPLATSSGQISDLGSLHNTIQCDISRNPNTNPPLDPSSPQQNSPVLQNPLRPASLLRKAYFAGCEVLRTEADFYELAMAYLSRCAEMNVRYTEPFFDIQAHTRRGVSANAVLDGYLRAQRDAVTMYGVRSQWILCFLRDESVEEGLAAYREARPWAGGSVEGWKGLFHAVGLASNAYERPPMLFEVGFQLARNDALHVTMHCDFGQKDTLEHVRQAVFEVCGGLGAERIDHGLDAWREEGLWRGLVERGIGLTLCPHAYHRRTETEVLFPMIRGLLEAGVKLCVNSDDPTLMHDVWIDGNLQKVYSYCGFGKREMVQLVRNAVDMSWAGDDVKKALYLELDGVDVLE